VLISLSISPSSINPIAPPAPCSSLSPSSIDRTPTSLRVQGQYESGFFQGEEFQPGVFVVRVLMATVFVSCFYVYTSACLPACLPASSTMGAGFLSLPYWPNPQTHIAISIDSHAPPLPYVYETKMKHTQDYVEAFKAAVRDKRFVARNFTFDPAAADVSCMHVCVPMDVCVCVCVHMCAWAWAWWRGDQGGLMWFG
jgi:hypothetical protein